jgi:hypothetical protein
MIQEMLQREAKGKGRSKKQKHTTADGMPSSLQSMVVCARKSHNFAVILESCSRLDVRFCRALYSLWLCDRVISIVALRLLIEGLSQSLSFRSFI